MQVIAKNYQTFGENFDVDEEQKTLEIKLNPPQPQYSARTERARAFIGCSVDPSSLTTD